MNDVNYFVIGTDGRHHGPLPSEEVRAWLLDGRANRYSRVRRQDQDQWVPLREVPEFEELTRPPHLGGGRPPGTDDEAPTDVEESRPEAASQPRLDPVSCFKRAWTLLTRDFAVLAGWTLAVSLVIIGVGLIPRVGWLIGLVVNNVLMAGLYVLFLAHVRGFHPTFQDVYGLVRASALTVIAAGFAQLAATLLGLFALIVPGIYLAVGYAFVLPLVLDRGMGVWDAMELSRKTVHQHWFSTFGLLLAAGLLIFASAELLGFGLVLTLPLCTGALMYAYEDLFGK